MLRETRLEARYLEIELTESAVMHDAENSPQAGPRAAPLGAEELVDQRLGEWAWVVRPSTTISTAPPCSRARAFPETVQSPSAVCTPYAPTVKW